MEEKDVDSLRAFDSRCALALAQSGVHELPDMRMILHDLRKLAQAIVGPVDTMEMAIEKGSMELVRESLGRIKNNSTCLVEMLGQLTTLPSIDPANSAQCDISQAIEHVVGSLAPSFRQKGINVHCRVSSPLYASISKTDFSRILLNLLVNASEAMERGDSIIVRAQKIDDKWVQVKVQDTGCGIPRKNLPYIFKEGHTTKQNHGGSGLGLAIVKRLAEAFHGTVRVRSRLGRGTQFTVRLPNWVGKCADECLSMAN